MTLQKRSLGTQGLSVGAIGLGCMPMSSHYGPADAEEAVATIHRAVELGCDFFDTAEVYGPYVNEELLAKGLEHRRNDVKISTKFGYKIEDGRVLGPDSRPATIRHAVEGSLRRLKTDRIDLLLQHRVDRVIPIEDVAGTVSDLIKEGKVLYYGLSEAGTKNIRRAHSVHPLSVLQAEYSLWERNLEEEIIPTLRELGIGLVPFSPLGRGFLTGTARRAEEYPDDDFRKQDPRYQGKNFDINMKAVEVVGLIATQLEVKPAEIALAWILHRGPDIVPIPGTERRSYLEQNLAAASVRLSIEQTGALDKALSTSRIAGQRYSESLMATVDR